MLKALVNNVRKAPLWRAGKRRDRRVFGFWCDPNLRLRVKALAHAIGIPIYPLGEHMLQLGLAHIRAQMAANAEDREQVMADLREHLQREHLLVDSLEHDEEVFATGTELNPKQAERLKAAMSLLDRVEEEGIPPARAVEVLGTLAARLQEERVRRKNRERLQREVDLGLLREVHRRYPRLIPELHKVMSGFSEQEMVEFLAPRPGERAPTWRRRKAPVI